MKKEYLLYNFLLFGVYLLSASLLILSTIGYAGGKFVWTFSQLPDSLGYILHEWDFYLDGLVVCVSLIGGFLTLSTLCWKTISRKMRILIAVLAYFPIPFFCMSLAEYGFSLDFVAFLFGNHGNDYLGISLFVMVWALVPIVWGIGYPELVRRLVIRLQAKGKLLFLKGKEEFIKRYAYGVLISANILMMLLGFLFFLGLTINEFKEEAYKETYERNLEIVQFRDNYNVLEMLHNGKYDILKKTYANLLNNYIKFSGLTVNGYPDIDYKVRAKIIVDIYERSQKSGMQDYFQAEDFQKVYKQALEIVSEDKK